MKSRSTIAISAIALALATLPHVVSQTVPETPKSDAVLDAIQAFKHRDKPTGLSNEVTVVLPPPTDEPAPAEKPDKSDEPDAPAAEETAAAEPAAPAEGLDVRVEKFQSAAAGSIDPADVKLLAPFPAKPLAEPPAGWKLDATAEAPAFSREVEVSPGTRITLTIKPHVLVPEADGATVFAVREPGYDSGLGYGQTATVGAVLSHSLRQLDDDAKQLGAAIDNLQQLLISLPAPAEHAPATKSKK